MSTLVLWSYIYKAAAFAGLLLQVYFVTHGYLSYPTSSSLHFLNIFDRIRPFDPAINRLPSLAVCTRYTDVMDLTTLSQLMNMTFSRSEDWGDIQMIESMVTIADIFNLTPHVSEALRSCYYRTADGMQFKLRHQPECGNDTFQVKKFYVFEHVCYSFQIVKAQEYRLSDLPGALTYPSLLFGVGMSSKFRGAAKILISVHYDNYPDISISYGHRFTRLSDFKSMIPIVGGIAVMYQRIQYEVLPAPYDTRCNNDFVWCKYYCWKVFQKQSHKISYHAIITKPIRMKQATRADLMDSGFRKNLSHRLNYCNDKCTMPCSYDFAVTTPQFYQPVESRRMRSAAFGVYIENQMQPAIKVQAYAKLHLLEYFIFMGSSIGAWLGIDIGSFQNSIFKLSRSRHGTRKRVRQRNRARPLTQPAPVHRRHTLAPLAKHAAGSRT